jgi:phosphoribosyl 1,2-cyclic phosphodiesterase
VNVTLWGTRGSLPTPGPETERYGGNTSCVEVRAEDGTVLVLDAGTGIRRLGGSLAGKLRRMDILLTHLHMDHIQGLGFFAPLFEPAVEVHVWGPASATLSLSERVARYLSPPLFPVRVRDLPSTVSLHELADGEFEIGSIGVTSALVVHPNPTLGYRIEADGRVLAYLPDHEPALGMTSRFDNPDWTSGTHLADRTDLLIHDSQYDRAEYETHIGWGHSSIHQALEFAQLASVTHLVPFHHDPSHDDATLDRMFETILTAADPGMTITPAQEGMSFAVGTSG